MMSWWCHHLLHGLNNPGSGCTNLEKEKKNSAKKLSNFQHKQLVFHHQTLIHQSWLKICTKTHKRRAIRNPSFRNPINWVPKKQKKKIISFPPKGVFFKSPIASKWRINIKRKKPQKLTSGKPWLIQKLKKKIAA